MSEPVLTEVRHDVGGEYVVRWWCEPPGMSDPHVVTEQTWSDNFQVRDIYAWEPSVKQSDNA